MSAIRSASAVDQIPQRSPRVRSAISNGGLPGKVSRCTAEGRRFSDIMHDLTGELGGDLSPAETLQVRTVAGLVIHVEQMQAAMLKGEHVDSEQLVRVSNSAARLITSLRRVRERRPSTRSGPSLAEYLAARAQAAE